MNPTETTINENKIKTDGSKALSDKDLELLLKEYKDGYLSEETLTNAIENRALKATCDTIDEVVEWGLSLAALYFIVTLPIPQFLSSLPSKILPVLLSQTETQTSRPDQVQSDSGLDNSGHKSEKEMMDEIKRLNPNLAKMSNPTKTGPLTSKQGMRFHPIHKYWRPHNGIDIGVPVGTPIYAPLPGVVTVSRWAGGCGIMVKIDHGNGINTRYCHNSRSLVSVGAKVHQGEQIALSGNTGGSTGPHLHFEVRKGDDVLDPLNFVKY